MTRPYEVLGFYKPTRWSAWRVGNYLIDLTRDNGLIPNRDPKHRHQYTAPWHSKLYCAYVRKRTVTNPRATSWHQDGDLVAGSLMDDTLVLWASNTPTEIKDKDGKVWIPKPYEIVMFKNLDVFHRRPQECPRVRWLFRQRVQNKLN